MITRDGMKERFAEYTLKTKISSYSQLTFLVRFKHMGDRCTLANVFGHGQSFGQSNASNTDFQGIYWSTFRESIQLKKYR